MTLPRPYDLEQLPMVDLVHETALDPVPLWERLLWADRVARGHMLTHSEGAVLRRICWRDGTGQGCFEGYHGMAVFLGYSERTIIRAVKSLESKDLISVKRRGQSETNIIQPLMTF